MASFDRSLTVAFGGVVLGLMTLFLAVAAVLSFQAQDRRQEFLATSLAQSVGESVNRVNVYQMPGLLEELQDRIPGLGYVTVADSQGVILAHSEPGWAGRPLSETGLATGNRDDLVWRGVHYWQRTLVLSGGLSSDVAGAILVGVSIDDLKQDQALFLWSLAGLTLAGTLAAMGAVWLLSRRFGDRVQSQLDRIIDKSPVGIVITNHATGQILKANETFQRTFGYQVEDIPTLNRWFERAYPEESYRVHVLKGVRADLDEALRTGGSMAPREVHITTKDGHVRTVLVATAVVGYTTSTTFVDRTEQKIAEDALRELNHSLEEKIQERTEELERTYRELVDTEKLAALGQLAAGMAHELNTPLGAIQSANGLNQEFLLRRLTGTLGTLFALSASEREEFQALSERNRDLAQTLPSLPNRSARRAVIRLWAAEGWDADEDLAEYALEFGLSETELRGLARSPQRQLVFRLSRDFLTLMRMTQVVADGVTKAAHVVSALRAYLKGTGDEVMVRFSVSDQIDSILTLFHHKSKHGVELVCDLRHDAYVLGDRQKLNQVWMNLVQNALQAMDYQGVLSLTVRQEDEHVLIEVGDSGPGIPDTIRDRIFEPYFTTKKRGEGMGLGLDLCRKILVEHHGSITFESKPGRTVFLVILPAARL